MVVRASPQQRVEDKSSFGDSRRTGENTASRVGEELVKHVYSRHPLEDFDKASSDVALIANEQQSGIVFDAFTPWWPALTGEVGTIVIGIGTSKNASAVIVLGYTQADVQIHGHNGIAVSIVGVEMNRIELALAAQCGEHLPWFQIARPRRRYSARR